VRLSLDHNFLMNKQHSSSLVTHFHVGPIALGHALSVRWDGFKELTEIVSELELLVYK
jgi:hypothetical protein